MIKIIGVNITKILSFFIYFVLLVFFRKSEVSLWCFTSRIRVARLLLAFIIARSLCFKNVSITFFTVSVELYLGNFNLFENHSITSLIGALKKVSLIWRFLLIYQLNVLLICGSLFAGLVSYSWLSLLLGNILNIVFLLKLSKYFATYFYNSFQMYGKSLNSSFINLTVLQ